MTEIKLPPITVICLISLIFIEPTVYLGLIFLSILLHEAGHITVMLILGIGIEKITVLPLGIDIRRSEKLIPYSQEIILSLAGIAVNLITFFLFGRYGFFACVNLLYALINLIPVKGLDGGYALEAFLLCFFTYETAEKVLRALSVFFCIILWMLGIYILLVLNGNISVFALSVFLFATLIMK